MRTTTLCVAAIAVTVTGALTFYAPDSVQSTEPPIVLPFDPTAAKPLGVLAVQKDAPAPKAGDAELPLKKAMLEDARKVYEHDIVRYKSGLIFSFEELFLWSSRWLEAELELAGDATARTNALKAHLERMKDVEKLSVAMFKVGQGREADAAAGRYYRTQAELWLARGRIK